MPDLRPYAQGVRPRRRDAYHASLVERGQQVAMTECQTLPRSAAMSLWSEISRLGIAIQLHELRESSVRELVDRLERHAKSENRAFYPWCLTAETPSIAGR